MKTIISSLVVGVALALVAGCSGSTPGATTASKPRSASDDPTMDPWERVGTQMKEKQSSAPADVAPVAAPVAAPAPVSQSAAAPAPVAPAPKAAQ